MCRFITHPPSLFMPYISLALSSEFSQIFLWLLQHGHFLQEDQLNTITLSPTENFSGSKKEEIHAFILLILYLALSYPIIKITFSAIKATNPLYILYILLTQSLQVCYRYWFNLYRLNLACYSLSVYWLDISCTMAAVSWPVKNT